MVKQKSRHTRKTVTKPSQMPAELPVLVPTEGSGDGQASFQEGDATRFQAVERFLPTQHKPRDNREVKRLAAVARLLSLAAGQDIDLEMLQEGFRSLIADAFGAELANLISANAPKNRKGWSWRWLPALFNREIQKARLVMWSPNDSEKFGFAVYCPDYATAQFVTLALSDLFGGWRACLGCGQMFTPHRRDQFYHDALCGHAHRQRRSRQRKA
jgi:hypothetical protein